MIKSTKIGKSALEDILGVISSALPAGMSEEIRRNLDASIRTVLENLDIATRSEMEVQEASLLRARQKLQDLEARIAELESNGNEVSEKSTSQSSSD